MRKFFSKLGKKFFSLGEEEECLDLDREIPNNPTVFLQKYEKFAVLKQLPHGTLTRICWAVVDFQNRKVKPVDPQILKRLEVVSEAAWILLHKNNELDAIVINTLIMNKEFDTCADLIEEFRSNPLLGHVSNLTQTIVFERVMKLRKSLGLVLDEKEEEAEIIALKQKIAEKESTLETEHSGRISDQVNHLRTMFSLLSAMNAIKEPYKK